MGLVVNKDEEDYIVDTKDFKISTRIVSYCVLAVIILLICWGAFLGQLLGNTNVGSLLAKRNFETQYWVYLQPEGRGDTSYRLLGDISRVDGNYYLNEVYWSNGGMSDFDDCQISEALEANGSASCKASSDNGGVHYGVRLGDKKAK